LLSQKVRIDVQSLKLNCCIRQIQDALRHRQKHHTVRIGAKEDVWYLNILVASDKFKILRLAKRIRRFALAQKNVWYTALEIHVKVAPKMAIHEALIKNTCMPKTCIVSLQ
jgi:hypothetical protein